MDIFEKCAKSAEYYASVRDRGIYPYYRAISSGQDPVVTHMGEELVMLGSNNYLGLANHPEVKEAAAVALAMFGTGCAGSRLLNGTLDIHLELEKRLATFLGREAVLTFATGFQVNLGVLSCLIGRSDVALLDALNHASIIDVYLNGTISELALRRSEYSSLIQREGFAALLTALDQRIDDLASGKVADRSS